jgi:hypothetical protein
MSVDKLDGVIDAALLDKMRTEAEASAAGGKAASG